MEEFMSENNPGAAVPQSDNRGNEQNREKRQRFDPAKQEGRKNNYNRNRRRRNNGQRQGGNDNNKRADNAEFQAEGGNKNQGRNRQGGRDQNKKFNRDQNQQGENRNENRKQFNSERRSKNKRPREIDAEVAKNVKKVETIDDIRSDNARITKEIYLEIASLKNINLN